jgi:hypothetical protein
MIPQRTGNAAVDRANWNKAWDAARLRQQKTYERSVAKQLARDAKWYGTVISRKPTETDENTIALHDAVCRCFATDPDAPAAREAAIRSLLPGGVVKWNGYFGTVESVTPNENGWKAVIKVSPQLPGSWFTPFRVIEEWQIGKDGSMQNLSCKPDPDALRGLMR